MRSCTGEWGRRAAWAHRGRVLLLTEFDGASAVENMCIHKLGQSLLTRLEALCDVHVREVIALTATGARETKARSTRRRCGRVRVLRVMRRTGAGAQAALVALLATWETHTRQMRLIRDIFMYLDRSYVLHSAGGVRSLVCVPRSRMRSCVRLREAITLPRPLPSLRARAAQRRGDLHL